MDFLEYGRITSDGCFIITKENLRRLGLHEENIENRIDLTNDVMLIPSIDVFLKLHNA